MIEVSESLRRESGYVSSELQMRIEPWTNHGVDICAEFHAMILHKTYLRIIGVTLTKIAKLSRHY